MDRLTPEQRHKNMSHIRGKNTSIELILRKELRANGFGYRIHYDSLPGKPDIVMTKYRIVIFCDSEFFHGKDFESLKEQLRKGERAEFWIEKIGRNIERDRENDQKLNALGWTVLHFWGKDIKKDPEKCIQTIRETIMNEKLNNLL